MTNCVACGKEFDNEIWLLGVTPEGEPEVRVFVHYRCDECWKKPPPKPSSPAKFYHYDLENGGTWDGILRCG